MTSPTVDERIRAIVEASTLLEVFASADVRHDVAELDRRTGTRTGLGLERTVVALAGSTGSGKSSLFNSLTGLALAATGVRRPTTAEPLACIWGDDGAGDLLDWLAVPGRRRVEHRSVLDDSSDGVAGLVLLDLPDHDSMVREHRVEVDRLVGLVDMVVWVTDPVKYADALLHEQYLSRLSRHGAVVMVVLNQVDRLTADEQRECVADLRRLLRRDGLSEVSMLATSAVDGSGVDELSRRIGDTVERRHAATDRLAADAATLAHRLRRAAGLDGWNPGESTGGASPQDAVVRVQRLLPIDAVRDTVAGRARAVATENLGGRARPDVTSPQTPDLAAGVPDAVTTVLRDHVDQGLASLPTSWQEGARAQMAPLVTDVVDGWRTEIATTVAASPAPRESWARLQLARRLLLAAAAAAGIVAVILLVLVLTGADVPTLLWALPLLLAAGAGAGLAVLATRLSSERQDYAEEAARNVENLLRARVERDIRERLDVPVVQRRHDCDAAVSALATAAAD